MCKINCISGFVVLAVLLVGPIHADLISHWKFDEGAGVIAYDPVNSNDGAIIGAQWAEGKFDHALSFDGINDYVLVGDQDSLESQELTLNFWAKVNDPSRGSNGGIAKGQVFGNANMFSYKMDFHEGLIRASVVNNEEVISGVAHPIGDNNWHMWTMTFGNNIINLYKDGVFAISTGYSGNILYGGDRFVIGARYEGEYSLDGKFDDVRVYNHVLSAGEVYALVPEPASVILVCLGGLASLRRKRT